MRRSSYFSCSCSLLFAISSYGTSRNATELSSFEETRVPTAKACASQSPLKAEFDPSDLSQLRNFTDDVWRLYGNIYNFLTPELIYGNRVFFKKFLGNYPQIQPDIEDFIYEIQFVTQIEKITKKTEFLYLDPWYFEPKTIDEIVSHLQNQFEEIKTNSKKFESFDEWLCFLFNLEKVANALEGYISENKITR